jgi:predicted acylesterase/phospholipase RssA
MLRQAIAIASLALSQVKAHDEYCRALVLSGGANNGAWEAGVLWGLTHYGNPADFAWDVVTGVSAGAINTGAIVVFATGDEVAMSEFLSY